MSACKCGSFAINDDPERVACDRCWRDAEIEQLKTCGVIEVMAANPNVDSWVREHDAEIERLRSKLQRVVDWLRHEANSPGGLASELELTIAELS